MPPTAPAPISLAPRVVVFDYGEVISREPTDADRAALVARAGVDAESFWTAYWAHREPLDQGTLSIAGYWTAVASDLGVEWDAVDVHELWALDHRGWLSVDPGTLRVLHALADGGTRLALLSNAGADFSGWLRSGSRAATAWRSSPTTAPRGRSGSSPPSGSARGGCRCTRTRRPTSAR